MKNNLPEKNSILDMLNKNTEARMDLELTFDQRRVLDGHNVAIMKRTISELVNMGLLTKNNQIIFEEVFSNMAY